MPAVVRRKVSRPCRSQWRDNRSAASRSISTASWQGQPAERQMSCSRRRCAALRPVWAADGAVMPRAAVELFDDLDTLPERHAVLDLGGGLLGCCVVPGGVGVGVTVDE